MGLQARSTSAPRPSLLRSTLPPLSLFRTPRRTGAFRSVLSAVRADICDGRQCLYDVWDRADDRILIHLGRIDGRIICGTSLICTKRSVLFVTNARLRDYVKAS